MRSRRLACALVLPAFALAACGDDTKDVDTAAYTCGDFNKSLATKGDNTSGNFINQLRKQAKLGQDEKTERREITVGVIFACRGKPASSKPAAKAIATAKQIKAGTFKAPPRSGKKKKSTN
jgi:hypothetical protein